MRFALVFLLLFGLLTGAFETTRGTGFERVLVERGILRPAVALINTLTPRDPVTLTGRSILRSNGSGIRVTRGCEGIELFLLLISGILAFPAAWRRKLHGILIGSVLAYILGIARLVSLHYIMVNSPAAWESMHGLVLPLAPVVLMAFFFLRWSSPRHREPTSMEDPGDRAGRGCEQSEAHRLFRARSAPTGSPPGR